MGEDHHTLRNQRRKLQREAAAAKAAAEAAASGEPAASGDAGASAGALPSGQQGAADGCLVYIGGLPFTYGEAEVRSAFAECGTIEQVHCMKFPDSGKFRGIALVTFATAAAAEKAKKWDGMEWEGRFLVIKPGRALPKEAKRAAPPVIGGVRPDERPKPVGSTTAYVGNLNFDTTVEELHAVFDGCPIAGVRIATDKTTGRQKGFAHVEFEDADALERALKMNGTLLRGRELAMHYSTTTGPSAKKKAVAQPQPQAEKPGKRKRPADGRSAKKR